MRKFNLFQNRFIMKKMGETPNKSETNWHFNGKFFTCNECFFKSINKLTTERHISSKHDGICYSCDICGYKSPYKENVSMHKKCLHSTESFQCNECTYTAKSKRYLTRHMRVHEDKKYTCELCDYMYGSIVDGNIHLRRTHSAKVKTSQSVLQRFDKSK